MCFIGCSSELKYIYICEFLRLTVSLNDKNIYIYIQGGPKVMCQRFELIARHLIT